jgi:small subunit ribosomal protein S8
MVDTISQLINGLKVSNLAKKDIVTFPYSKFKEAILTTLEKEGYVKSFSKKGKKVIKTLEVELAYVEGKSKIEGVQQVSKNSRRLYFKSDEVHGVRNGYGLLVMTTPKGIMTDRQARKEKVGGEALFKIW